MISNKSIEKFSKRKNRYFDDDDDPRPKTSRKFRPKNKSPKVKDEDYWYPGKHRVTRP